MQDTKRFRENAERLEHIADLAGRNTAVRDLLLCVAVRWRLLAEDIDANANQIQSRPTRPKSARFLDAIQMRGFRSATHVTSGAIRPPTG